MGGCTSIFRVAIVPRPRPGNRAGLTPLMTIPCVLAHSVKTSCFSPGHQVGFMLTVGLDN